MAVKMDQRELTLRRNEVVSPIGEGEAEIEDPEVEEPADDEEADQDEEMGDNDAKYQLRLDAGEVVHGQKNVYLQVNSQAKNDALKRFRGKNGSYAKLATATVHPKHRRANRFQHFEDHSRSLCNRPIRGERYYRRCPSTLRG